MKRSEMVIVISNWLLETCPNEYQQQSSYGRGIDASDLLDKIEEAGMYPPGPPTLSVVQINNDRYIPTDTIITTYKWELEDGETEE